MTSLLADDERWRVLHADNADVLPGLPALCVEHVITDPPYSEQTHRGARTLADNAEDQRLGIDFAALPGFAFVPDLIRIASRWCLAFCELEQLGGYKLAAGSAWVRAAIWHRTDGTPQLTGDRPAQAAEGIAIIHGKAKRKAWNGGGGRGHWSFGVERTDRQHPTQKPLDLMLHLVELFTDPNDLVFDPFCGSGTTGVACLRLGRRFVGIERDERYVAVARERLAAEQQGLSLRDARAGQMPLFTEVTR